MFCRQAVAFLPQKKNCSRSCFSIQISSSDHTLHVAFTDKRPSWPKAICMSNVNSLRLTALSFFRSCSIGVVPKLCVKSRKNIEESFKPERAWCEFLNLKRTFSYTQKCKSFAPKCYKVAHMFQVVRNARTLHDSLGHKGNRWKRFRPFAGMAVGR